MPETPGHATLRLMGKDKKAGPSVKKVPPGDDRERLVCPDCGYVAYDNPKIVAAAVAVWEDRFLICRRAIEPRKGYWTIPAGYLELNETTAEGAKRETWEEARAEVEIEGLIGIYEIPRISQVYVIHHARMTSPDHAAGPESEDVTLAQWQDIPWDDMAFPSVTWGLKRFREGLGPVIFSASPDDPWGGGGAS